MLADRHKQANTQTIMLVTIIIIIIIIIINRFV